MVDALCGGTEQSARRDMNAQKREESVRRRSPYPAPSADECMQRCEGEESLYQVCRSGCTVIEQNAKDVAKAPRSKAEAVWRR